MSWKETIEELEKTMTIRQIATYVGVTVQTIYQVRAGDITPKNSTAGALQRLLKREKAVQNTRKRIDARDTSEAQD